MKMCAMKSPAAPFPALVLLAASVLLAAPVWSADEIEITPPPEGSVTREEGIAAWDRIYQVTSHPRCANCHVGASGVPMWSGPSYGETRPHGMNITAGISRIGNDTLLCSTCHAARDSVNDHPHAAPQVPGTWLLPPPEMQWFAKSSTEICAQLRDPARNGDRTLADLADHAAHDHFVHWGWHPGGGRSPAPGTQAAHVNDILIWGTAGFPCADD